MDPPKVDSKPSTSAVAVKLPQFWPHNAPLWFAQAEAQFALTNVTASLTKYYSTISALSDSVRVDIDDLLDPTGDSPYEVLKARLLERFTATADEQFRCLIDASGIGDQQLSQLFPEASRESSELQMLRAEVANLREQFRALTVSSSTRRSRQSPGRPSTRPVANRQRRNSPAHLSPTALCYFHRKRIGRTAGAVDCSAITDNRHLFFIQDNRTKQMFLVDTGSEVSVVPPSSLTYAQRRHPSALSLVAANGTSIPTFGRRTLNLDFGTGKQFQWTFLIATVRQPILGADFLRNFNLLVDIKRRQLIDATTFHVIDGRPPKGNTRKLTSALREAQSPSHAVLARFSDLTSCTMNSQPPAKAAPTRQAAARKGRI
uniref:Peptidase A2 domain-containing protein n=1 Tax=Trichuris muris TaxID=70415 RepID=A0A5S6Q068_TRIMR